MKLSYLDRKLEVKFDAKKNVPVGTFSGYGAMFNNVDSAAAT